MKKTNALQINTASKRAAIKAFLMAALAIFLMTGCEFIPSQDNTVASLPTDVLTPENNGTSEIAKNDAPENPENKVIDEKSKERLYVLKKIESDTESIYLYSRSTGKELKYKYCLTTRFLNKTGKSISSLHFKPGMIVILGDFISENGAVSFVQMADDTWEQSDITKFSVDVERGVFTIGSTNYKLTDDTVIFSDEKRIKASDITKKDILRVAGRGKELYSVTVTTGHGFVQLINSSLFVDSVICIGNKNLALIDGDMIIEVPEGMYDITVANDGWGGTGSYEVVRGETTLVDLDELKGDGPSYCRLQFALLVDGANVFLDGELVDTVEPLQVRYGRHSLRVTCAGYTDWARTLFVNSPTATISLDLTDEKKTASTGNGSGNNNSNSSSNSNNTQNSGGNTSNSTPNSGNNNTQTGTGNSNNNNTGNNNNTNTTDKNKAELDYLTTISNLLTNML